MNRNIVIYASEYVAQCPCGWVNSSNSRTLLEQLADSHTCIA